MFNKTQIKFIIPAKCGCGFAVDGGKMENSQKWPICATGSSDLLMS